MSTPVIAAALRRALRDDPGIFAPVADHPATETALVATFAELSDASAAGLAALAGAGRRAHDVVRLCRQARAQLADAWYDESDLTDAAAAAGAPRAGGAWRPSWATSWSTSPRTSCAGRRRCWRPWPGSCPPRRWWG